jgi:secernin
MCDTFVALGNATQDGSVIFGKNSDRDPNEAHQLVLIPHATHSDDQETQCTYIRVPQVKETNAVLLSKPFWIWGAEMGANHHGVVIGNEALFTKVPYGKEPGLIGMDFLRLALERASSADQALDVIIELLETYGQSGNCGFSHELFYHNGFLIADTQEAWVLETAGKHWAAEKVRDVRSISNVISIGSTWDRVSDDLISHAVSMGWCKDADAFNFSRCYSDLIYTKFSAGKQRLCRTVELLRENVGEIDVTFAMGLLRDHGSDPGKDWQPGKGLLGADVCMHASFGPVRISQTTGSLVSHLGPEKQTHWVSGTSAPCTSVYKPVWIDSGLPDLGPAPTGTYDQATMWWQHENLHREILRDYVTRISVVESGRKDLENGFLAQIPEINQQSVQDKGQFTRQCFEEAAQATSEWLAAIENMPVQHKRPLLDKLAWQKFDREAGRSQSRV